MWGTGGTGGACVGLGGGKRKFLLIVPLRFLPAFSSSSSSSSPPSCSSPPESSDSSAIRCVRGSPAECGGSTAGGEVEVTRWGGMDWRLAACFCCVGDAVELRCEGDWRFAWDMDWGRKCDGDAGLSPR